MAKKKFVIPVLSGYLVELGVADLPEGPTLTLLEFSTKAAASREVSGLCLVGEIAQGEVYTGRAKSIVSGVRLSSWSRIEGFRYKGSVVRKVMPIPIKDSAREALLLLLNKHLLYENHIAAFTAASRESVENETTDAVAT